LNILLKKNKKKNKKKRNKKEQNRNKHQPLLTPLHPQKGTAHRIRDELRNRDCAKPTLKCFTVSTRKNGNFFKMGAAGAHFLRLMNVGTTAHLFF
jgi:hypothetical protein